MKIKMLLMLALISFTIPLFAQYDTTFWFAAPTIVPYYTTPLNKPILLRLISKDDDATVTISEPANSSFKPITVDIPKGSINSLDLTPFISDIECLPANIILNKGILIQSSAKILAFYDIVSSPGDPETYALKGHYALGTNFVVPGQDLYSNHNAYSPTPYDRFYIVASENNTKVTINPSNDILGNASKQPFDIVLNKGQVYMAQATSQYSNYHLRGSIVTSDKPVAITICDDLLSVDYCQNQAGDQILPIANLGTEYAVVKGDLSGNDFVVVMATDDNTHIFIDGGSNSINLNKYAFYDIKIVSNLLYIKSDKPIYALHYTGVACEIGNSTLIPISCGNGINNFDYSFVQTLYDNNSGVLLISVPKGHENDFLLNNKKPNINFSPFNGKPNLLGGKYYITNYPYNNDFNLINTTSNFNLGFLQGKQYGGSYSYFSDFTAGSGNDTKEFNLILPNVTTKYGVSNICLPISLKADSKYLPLDFNNFSMDISLEDKIFIVDSVKNCTFSQKSIGGKSIITLKINKLTITQDSTEIIRIYGRVLSNDLLVHHVEIVGLTSDESACRVQNLVNGTISMVCDYNFPTIDFTLKVFDIFTAIGNDNINIPVSINSDKKYLPYEMNNISINLSIENSIFSLDSVSNGTVTKQTIGGIMYLTLTFNKLLITMDNQIVTNIYGKMITNDTVRHNINIDSMNYFEKPCIKPTLANGSLSRICGPSSFRYESFTSYNDINLIGNSNLEKDFIRLTTSRINQVGVVWLKEKKPVFAGFITNFKFRFLMGNNNNCTDNSLPGADGIAFVIQNYNPLINGFFGGSIGYEGITNAFVIEYDTFNNDSTQIENYYDPNGNHIAIQASKDKPVSAKHISPDLKAINSNILPIKSDGTIYYSRVEYDKYNNLLNVYLDTTQNYKAPVLVINNFNLNDMITLDNNSLAWIGFTSATGCAYEIHDLLYWDFCSFYPNKPVSVEENNSNQTDAPDCIYEFNSIIIKSPYHGHNISDITLYNLFGQKLQSYNNFDDNFGQIVLPIPNLLSGAYFIKIDFKNNSTIYKKLLIFK